MLLIPHPALERLVPLRGNGEGGIDAERVRNMGKQ